MELKPRVPTKHYPIRKSTAVAVVCPVYTWDITREVDNADSFTACEVVGFIYGDRHCVGGQFGFKLNNGVIEDFFNVNAHCALSGEVVGTSTESEDDSVLKWVVDNSKELSSLHHPRNLLESALLLAHCNGGIVVTLTQEKGKPPFSYRFVGNPEDYLPVMWVRTLPSKVRIKIRALWESSDEGYTDYFDRRDLALLKGWLAER